MDLFSNIDIEPARQRIDELTELLDRYNYEYYMNDRSLVSDFEFDKLLRELADLERQHPDLASPNSPTKRVGGEVNKSFRQVTHRFPMLSLGNTYSIDEIVDFEARTRKLLGDTAFSYTCELKYDGVAIGLTYKHGELVQAVTRGNGSVGDDITANARTIPTIPLRLRGNYPDDFEVRGEVVYPFSEFEAFNRQREADGDEPFANPRNAASGSLKLQDTAECARRKLQFCPYFVMLPQVNGELGTESATHPGLILRFAIGTATGSPFTPLERGGSDAVREGRKTGNGEYSTHFDRMQSLIQMGFKVQPYMKECLNINEIREYIDYWDNERWNLPFGTDGIVIKVNQVALWDLLGLTAKSPRWAIAFKFKAQQVSTPLESISFQVGRTGIITPVANLTPVWLGGTTVKRATLVNADFIEKMDIREGDSLLVEKGGEIIPKIVGVDIAKRKAGALPVNYITNCPECGTRLVRADGEAGHYCPNSDGCPPQIVGRLEHFVSRKAMNIDSLGSERLEMLYKKGLVMDIADIYSLTREQLIGLESYDESGQRRASIQEKGADNILAAIEKSKEVPFERVLFALGIRFVGEVGAKKLARHFGDIDTLIAASEEELASVEDVGEKTAKFIYDYFSDLRHMQLIQRLRDAGLVFKVDKSSYQQSDVLHGKTFVVSGVFSHFSRDEIKADIEKNGGKVSGSISGKTDYLLAGDKMGPEKRKKAEKLGVAIISEDDYLGMVR
ncbi:MAG: NAD-dependent DNA ligase LigA [Bacteroidales bacterium]|nr:NAD-dependent DNA ligase LigA [Bacteroidales bacterium]